MSMPRRWLPCGRDCATWHKLLQSGAARRHVCRAACALNCVALLVVSSCSARKADKGGRAAQVKQLEAGLTNAHTHLAGEQSPQE
ncbi:MAG: hypothetical protein ACPGUV_13600, partial [Polyangiales bacterium]